MLDKIRGKKKNDKDTPDLRSKNNKKDESEVKDRLKGMVGKVKKKEESSKEEPKKPSPERKMPRPMPKPTPKAGDKPRLRPPEKKPEGKKPGMPGRGGFGRKLPEDDQRTLIGAAVFGLYNNCWRRILFFSLRTLPE